MAMMELRTALAILCTRFHFRVASQMGGLEGLIASEQMALTLHVHGGVQIHCTPIKKRGCRNVTSLVNQTDTASWTESIIRLDRVNQCSP